MLLWLLLLWGCSGVLGDCDNGADDNKDEQQCCPTTLLDDA